jgi:hypothetical protein
MPNSHLMGSFRNSATSAALLLVFNCGVTNGSLASPPPSASPPTSAWSTDANSVARATRLERPSVPAMPKAPIGHTPPLSEFGNRLLALRRAAIADGMQLKSAEEINAEVRAAREA